jgi:hypothetical protein
MKALLAELGRQIAEKNAELAEKDAKIEEKDAKLAEKDAKIEELKILAITTKPNRQTYEEFIESAENVRHLSIASSPSIDLMGMAQQIKNFFLSFEPKSISTGGVLYLFLAGILIGRM